MEKLNGYKVHIEYKNEEIKDQFFQNREDAFRYARKMTEDTSTRYVYLSETRIYNFK